MGVCHEDAHCHRYGNRGGGAGRLAWLFRFYTNTDSGRFYKNDRWTWKTLVVEKDGFVHWLCRRRTGRSLPTGDGEAPVENLELCDLTSYGYKMVHFWRF